MDSYAEYVVAFLDILGFKNIINTEDFENVRQIFLAIISEKDAKIALTKAIGSTDPKGASLARYNQILREELKIHIMSDSVVVAAPCQFPQSLAVVIDVCMIIQQKLFNLEQPIFLRGAISKGNFYVDNNMIFGKALVNAYIAQENYAEYPRIILSDEVQSGMDNTIINEDDLLRDDDGYWYINALESYIDFPAWDGLEKNPKYKKLRNKIDQQLSGYADSSVRKKYLWLKRKLNDIEFKASCY
ncbi:hypothetical protein [uncultured Oscillibacter sp.]|uniref:hypothetical protein n=1 Tax=Candidatus Allofournierella excrementigallinarum TaxID=2838592 RepID=UPI0026353B14|nr:hypothetical protein [uncultured Oscillibacter sp.]